MLMMGRTKDASRIHRDQALGDAAGRRRGKASLTASSLIASSLFACMLAMPVLLVPQPASAQQIVVMVQG